MRHEENIGNTRPSHYCTSKLDWGTKRKIRVSFWKKQTKLSHINGKSNSSKRGGEGIVAGQDSIWFAGKISFCIK